LASCPLVKTAQAPEIDPAAGDPAALGAALRLVLASFLFALLAAGTKLATRRLPGPEVALVRFLTGIVAVAAALATGRAHIRPRRWGWLLARGFFGGSAVVAYFAAIAAVPVGVATLLNQTQPVYTMLFSWALLGERPRRGALGALALTLIGVTVIVGARHLHFGASRGELLGVFSAVASGVAVTSIRAARRDLGDGSQSETAWSVFFSFTALGALVTLPAVLPPLGRWVAPTAAEWALLAGVGVVSVGAQVLMTDALRHVTGVQSGTISQLTVPLTVLLGVVFLGEHLTISFIAGAALTVSGVVLTIRAAAPGMISKLRI
jgi:drug/metabolite transporter (DMT)-like permease